MKSYDIWVTCNSELFGVNTISKPTTTLLARSPQEAVQRAYKKGVRHKSIYSGVSSSALFGRYAVRPSDKVSERFTTYWK